MEELSLKTGLLKKNGEYSLDLEDLENKLKENPKLFILCNPHNPLGHVWTRDELEAIGNLCVKYKVTVISDEIHADLTLWDNKHIPMASISEEIRQKYNNLHFLLEKPLILQDFKAQHCF